MVRGVFDEGPPDTLQLLNGWRATLDNRDVRLPHRAQRLVAFLALEGARTRAHVAALLWPDTTDQHALGNLRAALTDVRRFADGLLDSSSEWLSIRSGVQVDVLRLGALRDRHGGWDDPASTAREMLVLGELLPGWYDDWVLAQRLTLSRLRLDILDGLLEQFLAAEDLRMAMRVATAAATLEPLRESSHRAMAQIYIAAGDPVMAFQVYRDFRRRSIAEFGLGPTPLFDELMEPLLKERQLRRTSVVPAPLPESPRSVDEASRLDGEAS